MGYDCAIANENGADVLGSSRWGYTMTESGEPCAACAWDVCVQYYSEGILMLCILTLCTWKVWEPVWWQAAWECVVFWLVTNLRDWTSGFTSREERAEVQLVITCLRYRLSFSLLRCTVTAIRGSRIVGFNCCSTQQIELAAAEGRIPSDWHFNTLFITVQYLLL